MSGKEAPASAEEAKQGADTSVAATLGRVEAEAWAELLLSALVNGVKGGNKCCPSPMPGCSHFTRPGRPRDSLDEETTDWRAVCGKTARTVRRAGSAKADPDPYHNP